MDEVAVILNDATRQRAAQAFVDAPDGWAMTLKPPTRTTEQNALLWPLLTEVSRGVCWHGQYLTKEAWKDVFTASLRKQQVVPGIDGGFVVCGLSTRVFSKKMFSDLIELILAFCAEQGVRISAPKGYESWQQ
jgi:hypothetical protein